MSAEILRAAAASMRQRAEAATNVTGASDWHPVVRQMHFAGEWGVRSSGGFVTGDTSEEEAEHIASWQPAVAFAVADWLDDEASWFDYARPSPSRTGAAAFGVARAYLGESDA